MMPVKRSQNWLPNIFNDFFGNEWVEKTNSTAPAVNILETENDYKVEIASPGLTKNDFRINITEDNELVVSMEKKSETEDKNKKGTYLRREFAYSQFQQTMILPDNVEKDKIEAKVENGVLTIDIPKKRLEEVKKSSRQIAVK